MTLRQLSSLVSARAWLTGAGLAVAIMLTAGAAAPAMAQERLE
jgi:hypothetical protein